MISNFPAGKFDISDRHGNLRIRSPHPRHQAENPPGESQAINFSFREKKDDGDQPAGWEMPAGVTMSNQLMQTSRVQLTRQFRCPQIETAIHGIRAKDFRKNSEKLLRLYAIVRDS
ncbi:hypothetical protein GC170_11425 [bacterium]|nr:hypothetical protein [bacterium]